MRLRLAVLLLALTAEAKPKDMPEAASYTTTGTTAPAAASTTTTLPQGQTQQEIDHELHMAANNQWVAMAEAAMAKRANVNSRDDHGWTPLHTALIHAGEKGHDPMPVVAMLLNAGAEVNVADSRGRTPLVFGARTGRARVLQAVVKGAHDLDHPNHVDGGATPLAYVAESSHHEAAEAAEVLLSARADVDKACRHHNDQSNLRRLKQMVQSRGPGSRVPEHVKRRLAEVEDEKPPPQVEKKPTIPVVEAHAPPRKPKGEDL